jgi:ribose transport system permease protein
MSAAVATIGRIQRKAPVLQLVALVALFIYGAASISGFSSSTSVRSMLVLAALLGLAALGQTLVMIVGGLDLSIPGFIVAGAILVSQLCGTHHWAFVPALAVIVVLSVAMGAATGWICHRFRIQPLIVTLGTGALASGACLAWTGGKLTGSAPTFLTDLTAANGTTLWMDVSPAVFAASALCSALVGILLAGFAGADQTLGDPYLFQGLTAVIVGGTTIMGARGDYTHTVLGALILTELTTILVGKGYETADQQIIFGVLILIVVAGYGRDTRIRDRV